ncbi:peptidoglycan binding domain containing protein [Diplodia corticola]|uniref:Peptidoglycan binding domain containing protein n=1 Tax=Diplodia corticola TaxID=236234 RepID=A0A1J9RB17_9PEZI|nr:peptidoglycan binding domain containing protein [Diplodia corticola]OJD29619.1 peptidoglycan binding domain containing protein [Diplodia corticola]
MKRLIICCDGTWYSADKGRDCIPSNVAQISRMIAPHGKRAETGEIVEQVVYYQTGVGAGPMSTLDSAWQGATGAGLEENVTTAYHYLANNYLGGPNDKDVDEIFLFGFSRGAYTARALAGMVTEMGLLWPQELHHFPDLYKVYSRHGERADKHDENENEEKGDEDSAIGVEDEVHCSGTDESLRTIRYTGKFWKTAEETANSIDKSLWDRIKIFHPDNADNDDSHIYHIVRIKAIGVWDTVGSRGLPESAFTSATGWNKGYQFHDTALNRKIDHAFHALSLDEHRGAFQPTMWYLDHPESDYGATTDLKQCWFPGFHADIGGGTTDNKSTQTSGIDQITLAWMCDQVDGLLEFDKTACKALLFKDELSSGRTEWAEEDTHDSIGWYKLPAAGGDVVRTPGMYKKKLANKTCARKKGDFVTNETVHPSVRWRMSKKTNYNPPAFKEHFGVLQTNGPAWEYKELDDHNESGNGAWWVRPEVPEKKSLIWGTADGERIVKLDEWWIREVQDPDRLNLEWNLLPHAVQDTLSTRNEYRPRSLKLLQEEDKGKYEFPIFCRNEY